MVCVCARARQFLVPLLGAPKKVKSVRLCVHVPVLPAPPKPPDRIQPNVLCGLLNTIVIRYSGQIIHYYVGLKLCIFLNAVFNQATIL